ncbi:UbiA prenyltransferase family [Xylogone sp. PMI_703]|nr:UbiA prenyltransferase family [Xylogone sp. PMI_703]
MQTLFLFTKSDLPTSTGINTTFAISGILAGSTIINGPELNWFDMAKGTLVALYFTWHLTLCFNLGNQRQPQSIVEDGVNKPWRPIPAGRITARSTRILQLVSNLSLLILCATRLEALKETTFYLFCTWLYNEQSWGDKSWWQRTLMNICGITTNRVASLHVAIAAVQAIDRYSFTEKGLYWCFICAGITGTTIQVQDLRDKEGDAKINRQTLPLILGDLPTRWLTAISIWIWSIVCPLYWNLGLVGCMIPILSGLAIAAHLLFYRTLEHDRASFRLVAVWWVSLYFLPVMKRHSW